MTDYSAIGDAVRAAFLADAWLGNTANVKTIEVFPRGLGIREMRDTLFFSVEEMPAISITPNSEPKTSGQTTVSEIFSNTRVEAAAISWHRDAQAGGRAHQNIVARIESVLERHKDAQNDLGLGARVTAVATRQEDLKKQGCFFFVSRTTAVVRLIEPF